MSFTISGVDSLTLADRLSQEYGIGVRAGMFCAHPLMRHLLGDAATASCEAEEGGTAPLNAVRVSFGAEQPTSTLIASSVR
ncbi:Aminotransferase OS=Streptomyces microflavus OX=1919 GN=Smic_21710 PE=4 SV=1 [Streptomyces microflavus]